MVVQEYRPPHFSVTLLMDWTTNHYRTLARLISKHAWLYTEMIATETIVYQEGNLDRFLGFSPEQYPIVLQIDGREFVGEAMSVIAANTGVPVTVKCRIGVDDRDSYNELCCILLLNVLVPCGFCNMQNSMCEYYCILLRDFPDLKFTVNGDINTIEEVLLFSISFNVFFVCLCNFNA
ncbi:hypothetical protein AKJ16_DCAP18335 [Drosera capensis]